MFIVEAGSGGFYRAVRGPPIGNYKTGKRPVFLENVGEEVFVFASVVTVERVVRAHDGRGIADGDANLEGEEIAFVKSAFADDDVDFVAAAFLIIDGVMLDVAEHVLRLFALDAIADEGAGENWVFTLIFEGAAIARFPRDVRAAAKRHVETLRAEFAADQSAVFASGLRVPTGCGCQIRRKRGGVTAVFTAVANAVGRVAHLNHRNSEARDTKDVAGTAIAESVAGAGLGHTTHAVAVQQIDLLVESHFFENEIGAGIGRKLRIHPRLLLSERGKSDQ